MANKKISIDINDVLRDYTRQFIKKFRDVINPSFHISYDEVTTNDFANLFPFESRGEYNNFVYDECALEIFGRAELMERNLGFRFSKWVENDVREACESVEDVPDLRLVSPFEMHLTIPSTLSFLARIGSKVREVYFPMDSLTIWDGCDLLVTANPKLLDNKPQGKISAKINTPYNRDCEADFTFDTFREFMESDVTERFVNNKI